MCTVNFKQEYGVEEYIALRTLSLIAIANNCKVPTWKLYHCTILMIVAYSTWIFCWNFVLTRL